MTESKIAFTFPPFPEPLKIVTTAIIKLVLISKVLPEDIQNPFKISPLVGQHQRIKFTPNSTTFNYRACYYKYVRSYS